MDDYSSASASALNAAATASASMLAYAGQEEANETNLQIARETNAHNYKIWQEQMAHNIDLYNMQVRNNFDMYNLQRNNNIKDWRMQFDAENKYNTASAQRQRLEDAGLNPYLMMNGGSAGIANSNAPAPASMGQAHVNPSQSPTMQGYHYESPLVKAVESGLASLNSVSQAINLNEQNKSISSERNYQETIARPHQQRMNAQEWRLSKANADIAQSNANVALSTEEARIQIANEQASYATQLAISQKIDNSIKQKMDYYFDGHQQLDLINKISDIVFKSKQIKVSEQEVKNLVADAFLKYAQAYEARTRGDKNVQEGEKLKIEVENLRDISDALVSATNAQYVEDTARSTNRYYWHKSISDEYKNPSFDLVRYIYDAFGVKPNYKGTKVNAGVSVGPVSINYGLEPGVQYD